MRRLRRALALSLAAAMASVPPATSFAAATTDPSGGYVGADACAPCHAREHERWSGSHHDLAMQEATADSVRGDFAGATFTANGVTSKFFRRDGKFFVHTDGPDGKLRDYPIAYTFGVEPLQQYLVAFPKGRYQALSIAWDTRPRAAGGQRWFHLYPDEKVTFDDVLHWTGPAQRWNSMCADCHSTNLRKGYRPADDSYETSWSQIDVSCEACHGPASKHVEWARAASAEGRKLEGDTGLVVRLEDEPATWVMDAKTGIARRSAPRRSNAELETCAACHSRRTVVAADARPGTPYLDAYLPALLADGLYEADGQIDDEVYVYGSFLQSKMVRAGVTCHDCHDPHRLEVRAAGNELCARCHLPAKFDSPSHHHHPAASPGARCVECHMPAKNYMVIDARRDHSLRVPRPDLTVEIGTPNACNGCHTKEDAAWAAAAVVKWYGTGREGTRHFGTAIEAGRRHLAGAGELLSALATDADQPGIARATALTLLPPHAEARRAAVVEACLADGDPLVRMAAAGAADTLDPATRLRLLASSLGDPLLAVRIEAARALAVVPRDSMSEAQRSALERGLDEYRAAQEVDRDRPFAHLNLGLLDVQLGNLAAAEKEYRAAIAIGPYFIPAYVNLADLCREQGRDQEGEKLLRKALEVETDNAEVRHALGLLLVREKRLPEAMDELWRAARLAPDEPRYAYVYGIALHSTGRSDRAVEVLRASHEKHPGDRETLLALVTISRERGARAEALGYARKLAALSPDDPLAKQLVADLERAE